MREQARQPRPVAQGRVEAEMRQLVAVGVEKPAGVGLRSDLLPDLLLKIRGQWLVHRCPHHLPQYIGLDAGVIKSRARRRDSVIELGHALDRAFAERSE